MFNTGGFDSGARLVDAWFDLFGADCEPLARRPIGCRGMWVRRTA